MEYTVNHDMQVISSWGILKIQQQENGPPGCSLTLPGGHTLFSVNMNTGTVQPLLPFPRVLEAERFLQRTENIAERALRAITPIKVRQTVLLEFCVAGGNAAVEFLETNPALALLLALKVKCDPAVNNFDQITALARLKRHDILRYCSYPDEKWVVRLLRKIPASQCSPYILDDLKHILQQNDYRRKILQHLEQLNRLVVDVMMDAELNAVVEGSFYSSASSYPESNGDIDVEYLIRELARFAREVHGFAAPRVRRLEELQRIHDQYLEYLFFEDDNFSEAVFASPPVQKLEIIRDDMVFGIFPLQSGKMLHMEGENMRHCIASYADGIAKGENLYAYHVYSPNGEEATVLIRRSITVWLLDEIRGHNNHDISVVTRSFVESWLAKHNTRILEAANRAETDPGRGDTSSKSVD